MAEKKKDTEIKDLKTKLFKEKKNLGKILSAAEQKKADKFCADYMNFLDKSKTEREAVKNAIIICEKNGFKEFQFDTKYKAGDKVYYNNRGKSLIAAVIGKNGSKNGVNIIAAHIDSPRIDLKQNPLYEDGELAYFKTHYYGGIKKYQWPTIPLSLHGVVIKNDGTSVEITIGEDPKDPVFVITDLLPHLAKNQYKRPVNELIMGEELNILIGSRPFKDDEASELVKLNIMKLINEKYDITESDFVSAELEAVPVFNSRDIGFDRSLIGSYGQDDRVCAYTALTAVAELKTAPTRTTMAVLADKEEVGSDGNTGLNSSFMKYFIEELAELDGVPARRVFTKSRCLSADVNAGFDPTFPDVLEKMNASFINYGVCVTKFTGSGGKGGTSDASAEFVGEVRQLFDKNKIVWQTGELGKVDMGGGGTVAMYVANLDIDTIDVGVPVLSMHAPFEVTSKFDVYMTYKAFDVFAKS